MLHRLAALFAVLIIAMTVATPVLAAGAVTPPGPGYASSDIEHIAVATQEATSVTESSATLNGYLESLLPYPTVEVWFELSNGQTTARRTMSSPGVFSPRISGLTPGTAYEFRAVAASTLMGGQMAEGNYMSFNTVPPMPKAPIQVSTSSAAEVTSGTAVLQGYVSSMGPYNSVSVWFNWGNSPNMVNNTGHQVLYGPGPFSIQVSGLSPNAIYYFRAAAKPEAIGVATVYGVAGSFNTSGGGTLSVSTGAEGGVTATSATIVGYLDSLGTYRNAYVWFEWGPTTGYGQTTTVQTTYNTGSFSHNLQGLNPGTTYHFRALAAPAVAGGVTVRGMDSVFTTTYAPGIQVLTSSASNVAASSATFNGVLSSSGASARVDVWFEWGSDPTLGNTTPRQTLTYPGNYSFNMTGLAPGSAYHYRAAAYANGVDVFGSTTSFRTTSSSPVSISTNSASSISTTAATLNAYVNSLGNVRSVDVRFQWGTTPSYGNTTQVQAVSYSGAVSMELNGLAPGADYYFQAFAQTPDGARVYGGQSVFTTISSSKAAVTASPATAISSSTAVLNGELRETGGAYGIQVWFEYGTTAQFGNSTPPFSMNSPGSFSTPVSGLVPGRAYYYRAVALNQTAGSRSVYSPISTFSTAGGPTPPGPQPEPGVPMFVWLIGGGMLMVIIILVILLGARR